MYYIDLRAAWYAAPTLLFYGTFSVGLSEFKSKYLSAFTTPSSLTCTLTFPIPSIGTLIVPVDSLCSFS